MLHAIRAGTFKYEFDDYKALLNLQCGIDQSSKDAAGDGISRSTAQAGAALEPPASAGPLSSVGGDRSRRMYNE